MTWPFWIFVGFVKLLNYDAIRLELYYPVILTLKYILAENRIKMYKKTFSISGGDNI